MDKVYLKFSAKSQNERLARTVASAFLLPLNPTIEEINDVKTAVSEAVTNSVVHAYPDGEGEIEIIMQLENRSLHIQIKDYGKGIEKVDEVMQPFFTTRENEERAGMGFTVMRAFMDGLDVQSKPFEGTTVTMTKNFA